MMNKELKEIFSNRLLDFIPAAVTNYHRQWTTKPNLSPFNFPLSPQNGFTLIELLLYITIFTIVLSSLIPFGWNIIYGNAKSSSQQEVYSQARFISERIKYKIRSAQNIQSVSSSQIILNDFDPNKNPTTISCSSGNITIQEGPNPAPVTNLNSNTITINPCTFTNYSSADSKTKNIQFSFTFNSKYNGSRQEYKVPPLTIQTSAEIRSN